MNDIDAAALFERIESALEPKLAAGGCVRTKHEYHPNMCGTRFSVYSGKKGHVRLTWDGKKESFILRVYRKRSRVVNTLLLSLLGKYDLDKLEQEIVATPDDIRTLTAEQLAAQFADSLRV